MGKFKSLGEISSDYELVIIDNSAFQEILINNSNPKSIEEKLESYLTKAKSLKFWKENIGHYENCYTIPEVIEELKDTKHYSYKKSIKGDPLMKTKPYLLQLRRAIREMGKERNRLATCLEDKERILKKNKDEDYLYDEFYEKHFKLEAYYRLHGADFPLLIFGAVTAKTRSSSAIISNDSAIGYAYNYLLKAENLSKEKFGFFTRNRISLFERK